MVDWAVLAGRLSVEVRNAGHRALAPSRVVITALDRLGTVVAATSGPTPACCLVASLDPGATTALFADLGTMAARVRSVRATPVAGPATRPAAPPAARVSVTDVSLQTSGTAATVRASVTPQISAAMIVRAVLVSGSGRLVTVAAGSVPCAAAGVGTPTALAVGSPLPPGTLVRSVSATASGACAGRGACA